MVRDTNVIVVGFVPCRFRNEFTKRNGQREGGRSCSQRPTVEVEPVSCCK
jgi:hypothetical protein